MVPKKLTTILAALVVTAFVAGAAQAQGTFGRLLLVVKDQDGNPVQGVKATATCKELRDFIEQKETNSKGKLTLAFSDATKVYDIKIEYPGTPTVEAPFKPVIKKTITQKMTIDLRGGAHAEMTSDDTASAGELTLRPSERIFNSGVELLEAGDYEGARDKFLQALKGIPDLTAAYSALGGVYIKLEDHPAAIDAAEKLLEFEPENPRGFRLLYEANRRLGNEEEAQKALKAMAALDTEGDSSRIVYNEGVEALRAGDRMAAKESFERALELDPGLTAAMSPLAVEYVNSGDFAAAVAMAERILESKPDDSKAMMIAFEAYKALGDAAKEQQAFDRLLASGSKGIAGPLYESGIDLFNNGKLDAAIRNFQQALEADPSIAKVHYHLGLCLVNQGDQGGAKEHFRRFLEMSPDDPDAELATEMLNSLD